MRFSNPQALHWLWLLPLLAGALHFFFYRRQTIMHRFISQHLLDALAVDFNIKRYQFKAMLLMAVFFWSVVALARPQWGFRLEEVKRHELDIMIAVDVSKSMLTQDVKPSRLGRTKLAIKDLLNHLKGDRVGLMAFAGQSFVLCPLTSDYNGFMLTLDDLSVDSIPRGGTDISLAIEESFKGYGKADQPYKTLVLVTDGEEEQGNALRAAEKAKAKGVRVYTIGVGTQQGDLIQVPDEQGQMSFLKDAEGRVIKSRLNEPLLQKIAYTTGGAYARGGGAQFGLDYLYKEQLSKLEKQDIEDKMTKQYIERFQWPLTLTVLLLLVDLFWGPWKKND